MKKPELMQVEPERLSDREKKLPKWVQDELVSLRRRLETQRRTIDAYAKQNERAAKKYPPDFYARYATEPNYRPIYNSGLLWLEYRAQRATYQVSAVTTGRGESVLCVRSITDGQLVVLPQVCNTIHIQAKR